MVDFDWQSFEPSAFDEARRTNRPVLLVITKPWCHHCRDLLEESLAGPEIGTLVADSFIPIHVDAERRPDVNDRYGAGGWPTIAYLTPGGELISNDGFLAADALAERLKTITGHFAENREQIEDGLRSLWSQKADVQSADSTGKLNQQIIEDVVDAIYEKFDHRYGGWGNQSKFPHPEAIDFALIQVVKQDDSRMREVVTLTLDRMAEGAIHDPIDGGFFRFSKTPDWRSPNHEKVLDANSMRLRCYLEAYQVFENPAYREVAEGIVRWMLDFMLDAETGCFFGDQDADADYYLFDKQGRSERPAPALDRTIYTNWNAMAISALLKSSVVLDRPELRTCAMNALQFILDHLYNPREGVFHYWDGTYHLPGMLSDQAYLIRALIDGAQHSGDSDLLLPAEAIAEMAIERQKAPGGGFYDILFDNRQHGPMRRRNRSILENSMMAEALLRLAYLSKRHEFHDEAVETLEAFTDDYKEYGYYVAGYGRAVDLIFYEPVTITIVGDCNSDAAQALRSAALATYVPSRIVQMLDPERDPVLLSRSGHPIEDRVVAHLALGLEKSSSTADPDELIQKIAELERQRR